MYILVYQRLIEIFVIYLMVIAFDAMILQNTVGRRSVQHW